MAFTLWGINLPTIPTSLAYGDRFILVDRLLLFISKKLKNQRRDRKVKPFDRDPPPADEKPPENAVVLILQLDFVDRADLYLVAAALGADDLFFAHGVFFFLFFSFSLCQRIVDSHFSSAMIIWAVAEVLPSAAVIFNAADFPARTTARLRP